MAEAAPSEMPLPPPTNTPTPSPTYTPTRQTAALPVCQKPAEIAPSELVLAYVAEWDGDLEIYSTTATRSVTRQITRNHWHDTEPQYSPDGEWLAWRGDARVQLISFAGLDDRWLTPDSLHPGFDWSPDSTKIVYTGYDNGVNSLWLKDVETGRGVNLTGSRSFIPRAPLFSPEGDRILFHVDPPDGTDPAARWFVVSSDGASLWQLSFPGVFTFDAVWHLDGQHVRFTGRSFSHSGRDLYVASIAGDMETLRFETIDPASPIWSPESSLIAYYFENSIYVATSDEAVAVPVLKPAQGESMIFRMTWAPDNQRIALNVYRTADTSDLYVLDICDGITRLVAEGVWSRYALSWRISR